MAPTLLVTEPVPPLLMGMTVNVLGAAENTAVAVSAAASVVNVQVADVELQLETDTGGESVHPPKTDPDPGVAVSETFVPIATDEFVHVPLAHGMVPETLPEPAPIRVTDTGYVEGTNVAPTDCAEFIVTLQGPEPEHAPLQLLNTAPAWAVGVRVTTVLWSKLAEQVAPQEIPAGELATEPDPVTSVLSVNCGTGAGPKVAVTF